MEPRKRPEYVLEVLADPICVKDIVRGASQSVRIDPEGSAGAH